MDNDANGRELDAIVAERVMGVERHPDGGWMLPVTRNGPLSAHPYPYPYSTVLWAAWQVVEKLRESYTNVALHAANGWGFTCWNVTESGEHTNIVGPFDADSPALAICRTALKAVEADHA